MLKRYISLALAALLVYTAQAAPAAAQAPAGSSSPGAGEVREKILSLGVGQAARVRVELRDKTKLDGFVSRSGADSFVVTDRAGRTTTVDYEQVRRAWGDNYLTGVMIRFGAPSKSRAIILNALGAAALVGMVIYWSKTGGF